MPQLEAKERREAIAKSVVVSQFALLGFFGQAFLTHTLHELNRNTPVDELRTIALAWLAITSLAGGTLEVIALKKKGYSSSPSTTLVYEITKNPYIAVGASKFYDIFQSLMNPVDIASIASLRSEDDGRFFFSNLGSKSTILFAYQVFAQSLILTGKVDAFAEGCKSTWKKVSRPAGIIYERSGLKKVDQWLYPPRMPAYPDIPKPTKYF